MSMYIDITRHCMLYYSLMNDVQTVITLLQEKGWTLAAIADEIRVAHNTIEKWKAGDRYPRLKKPVLDSLDRLLSLRRIPKKRRYHLSKSILPS